MHRTSLHHLFAAALLVAGVAAVPAQERPKPPAYSHPEEAGPDFEIQGEYAGAIQRTHSVKENIGLQVVALGDGKFNAVLYRGGLPGAGWNRGAKTHYTGALANGKLNLTGPKDKLTVQRGGAVVLTDAGEEIGRLPRIERRSPTLGMPPPPDSLLLFGGLLVDRLQNPKETVGGLVPAGFLTKMSVSEFQLHLEFRTPFMPTARGQERANSGVYIQQRYEVQVLDSFGLEGAENECGGLYRQTRPEMNMCLPPLTWQTYDIWFTPAKFAADGKTKLTSARISVLHNGIPVHWHRELTAKTGGGKPEGPNPLPINFQDHKNPVVFQNIWIINERGDYAARQSLAAVWQPSKQPSLLVR